MPILKYAKLQDARILLLGGTSGIGFATAEASIEAGATVIVSSSTLERLATALNRSRTAYPEAASANKIQGHLCDLSKAETLEANIGALLEFATNHNNQKLDHIIYTAADIPRLPGIKDYQVTETKLSTLIIRYEAPIILGKLSPAFMNLGPKSSIALTGALNCY